MLIRAAVPLLEELDTAHRILHNKSLELSRSAVADVSSGQKEAQGAGSFLQHLAMSDKGLDNYQVRPCDP